jgi:GT2 family glycosyltransferase
MTSFISITIAIPTYGRDQVLVDTIRHILALVPPPAEVIVLDQSKEHVPEVARTLETWHHAGAIRWLQLPEPLIPRAMNRGLIEARGEIVLFLDDDVVPEPGLIRAHANGHEQTSASLVAGRVIQPWQEGIDFSHNNEFHFACCRPTWIEEFMAGNFSVRRDVALKLGGFDERFMRVAYNFEAEFAHRWRHAGHKIYFEPAATVHHLRVTAGGTRMFGQHLRSFRPNHAVGAYYYFLRTWSGRKSIRQFLGRPLRAISTRHHLRRPWWILATLIAEFAGMVWALALAVRGPRYVSLTAGKTEPAASTEINNIARRPQSPRFQRWFSRSVHSARRQGRD